MVSTWLARDEYETVAAVAESAGLSIAAFTRRAAVGEAHRHLKRQARQRIAVAAAVMEEAEV
jgi:hypothetical protein